MVTGTPHAVPASLYIVGVWIRHPKELYMICLGVPVLFFGVLWIAQGLFSIKTGMTPASSDECGRGSEVPREKYPIIFWINILAIVGFGVLFVTVGIILILM